MSVKRKGPKATAVRVATYALLITVAIIVLFPFVVAVSTSMKRNTDIFTYPPSLVPRTETTVTDPELGFDSATVYELPGRDGEYALVEDDVPIAEFRRLDDPEVIIARPPTDGVETDRTTVVDGDEETIYLLDVDGEEVEVVPCPAHRRRPVRAARRRGRVGGRAGQPCDPRAGLRAALRELLRGDHREEPGPVVDQHRAWSRSPWSSARSSRRSSAATRSPASTSRAATSCSCSTSAR